MKKILLMMMALVLSVPIWAGEKTVTISRNEGIYDDGTGVYYCTKGGITMTFSSGLNNVNYLVEHQQVVFDIFSTNYVIKKIKFNCLDNTTDDNLDCFYWGPSTISEFTGAPYEPTGTYTWSGYIGTWIGGSTPSKYVKFVTEAKPVRFGSVEITYDKEFGDIYDLVRYNSEIQNGQTYALVSKYDSRALGKEEFHGNDPVMTFSSTPVTLLNFDETLNNYLKVKVTDEVSLMKLESSGNSDRPWYIKIGDNYLRRRTGTMQGSGGAANGQGWNIYTVSSIPSGSESYFRTRITVENNNNNALIRYSHTSSETSNNETFAIRHYNGGDLFRVIDYNTSNNTYANNQRVYLYKPAEPYIITTECLPSANDGYITLSDGVLLDNQGNQTSQMGDTVKFFVGPTNGWGVGTVTVTNLTTGVVTTLTPTSTSDFGNNYQFPMPGANVHVTANFLPPYDIHTVNNPVDGGDFNFLNGYTDFNGQTTSNEGKTVTFKIDPADDYMVTSVTYTDDVTGQSTTLTPDADGVYTFVMPNNSVTLTANYELAADLYLLGTANGGDWAPSGPKFNYDAQTGEYYLDVYFKGNVNTSDPYGHFSLTKRISDNWNDIANYRLVASTNDYDVWDGQTANLYKTSDGANPNNAFRIPAGVYRITVNQNMTEVSITEYPLTVTFDPVSGTIVESGDVVSFTSNLNDLVHAINDQEDPATYSSTDNWGASASGNTHTITHEGTTTVTGQSNIGYITATGTADYEIISDLYLLGTANGMNSWQPYGPQFTYNPTTETYSLDVYFTGLNVNAADEGFGYFSLTKIISDPANPSWNDIPNSARLNAQYNDFPITGLAYNQSTTADLYQTDPNWCFKIDPGVYTITVNKDKTEMTVTKHELTLTFNPVSGTTVAAGDQVNISSNLEQLVYAINPNETLHQTIMYATSTDGTLQTPDTQGSTVTITAVDATTTVNAEAKLGYITVTGNANYIVPAPPVYSITTIVTPEGAGTITAPAGATAGTTVTFTVDTNEGYRLDQVEVTYGYSQAILDYTYNPETGEYSFVMPDDEVKIFADYSESHDITTVVNPDGAGTITVAEDAFAGETVTFTVTANTGYSFDGDVTVTYTDGSTGTITVTDNGDGTYSFTMPDNAVTITAEFDELPHSITTVCNPDHAGTITLTGDAADGDEVAGQTVNFTVEANTGFTVNTVTVTYDDGSTQTVDVTDNGDGTYSFVMPAEDVVVTANFNLKGEIFKLVTETSQLIEGKTYTYIARTRDKVLNYISPDATPNYYSSTDIVEWVNADKSLVKLDGNACFFTLEDVTDVVNNQNVAYRSAYLKTTGGYLGLEPTASPVAGDLGYITLCASKEDVRKIATRIASNQYAFTNHAFSLYDFSGGDDARYWMVNYDDDYEGFNFIYYKVTGVHLYKLAESYNITTVVLPDETAGSLTIEQTEGVVGATALEGMPVTVTPTPADGYAVTSFVVTIDGTSETVPVTSNVDGSYSFTMPSADATVTVEFDRSYNIYTESHPEGSGEITVVPSACAGQDITFVVTPNAGYALDYVSVHDDQSSDITLIDNGDGSYTFTMPEADVYIDAYFVAGYTINTVVIPDEGGNLEAYWDGHAYVTQYAEGTDIYVDLYPNTGYEVIKITLTNETTGETEDLNVELEEGGTMYMSDFIMPASNVTVTAYLKLNSPLSFIEYPETFEDGDPVTVTDTLIGAWAAKKYLWAKDQRRSNFYLEKDEDAIDYLRTWYRLQYRDWDQSNWVMLDFSTIPGYENYSQEQLMAVMKPYVDNYIEGGSIKGTYRCVFSYQDVFEVYHEHVKVQHIIELSELPHYVNEPATIGPNNTLGYPGFRNDPQEKDGKYYANAKANYAYNHYTPANFLLKNTTSQGIIKDYIDEHGEYVDDYTMFFMRPKDQEVIQIWGVWLGLTKYKDNITGQDREDNIFVVYATDVTSGINALDIEGAFRVESWDYNINETDASGNPIGYGPPSGELRPDMDYTFHAAVQYSPCGSPISAPRRVTGEAMHDVYPEYYNVYPLDMTSSSETYTGVKEVVSRDASTIVDIRYYNIMGQESMTPFEGINIMVVRYKDGSFISKKILK